MISKTEDDNAVVIDHDIINEQIVLAAVLVNEKLRDKHVAREPSDNFVETDHALIWDAMKEVLRRKKGFDLQQLHALLPKKIKLKFLQTLMDTYPDSPVDMEGHMRTLRWDGTRARATMETIPDFLRALKEGTTDPTKVYALAERVTRSLKVTADGSFMSNAKTLAAQQRAEMEKRRDNRSYEYGIHELDFYPNGDYRCIPGAAPGKITNITAVSGCGKSVLAAFLALQQARRGRRVLYGAWEMGPGDTVEAMATISFQVMDPQGRSEPAPDFRDNMGNLGSRYATSTGALEDGELDTIQERMERIGEMVRFFDPPFADDPGRDYSNEDALDALHWQIVDSGAEVVVYDLFERCLADGSPGAERKALFRLQQIHQKTNTHGLICTQQKIKEVEKRDDKRPARDTILGSQAWVDISDTIITIHLPARWKAVADDTAEVSIIKQRFGKWPQTISFTWDGDEMSFRNGQDVDFAHPTGKTAGIL